MTGRPRDSQREKFWAAIYMMNMGLTFESMREVQVYCNRITNSAWWKKRRPDIDSVMVIVKADTLGMPAGSSHGTHYELRVHQNYWRQLYVLLAMSRATIPANVALHGPEAAQALLAIVGRFMGKESKDALRERFRECRVKTKVYSPEAREAAKARYAERDLRALLAEFQA